MTPDLDKAIRNHNNEMSGWWRRPEYIRARKAYVKRNPVCKRCGRPTQTPGHCHDDYQHGFEHYLGRVIQDDCEPLCNRCNLNEKHVRKPCPRCVEIARKHGYELIYQIRYIPQDAEVCFNHLPEKDQHRIWTRKRKKLDRHVCGWHRGTQRCTNALRYSSVCDRKSLDAEGCDYFMKKGVPGDGKA